MILISQQFQFHMNFNRIQKYRSQQAIPQPNPHKNHHRIAHRQTSPIKSSTSLNQICEIQSNNKNEISIKSSQTSHSHTGIITLRDYLQLTSNQQNNTSPQKKINKTSLQLKKVQSEGQQKSKSLLRKEKPQVSTGQIFKIVKKDIGKDMQRVTEMALNISAQFQDNIQHQHLSNTQMIQIYNFRKRLRENVMKQLHALNSIINSMVNTRKSNHEDDQMPVIFEEQEERRCEYSTPLPKRVENGEEDICISRSYSYQY